MTPDAFYQILSSMMLGSFLGFLMAGAEAYYAEWLGWSARVPIKLKEPRA